MVASLVSIPDFIRGRSTRKTTGPWTNQELAELCRVVNLLARAGLTVETDSGQTDEGDPWMVFLRPGTGDVIAHFARIDGRFVAAGAGAGLVVEGDSFRDVVDQILDGQPLLMSQSGPFAGLSSAEPQAAVGGGTRGRRSGGVGAAGSGRSADATGGGDSGNVTTLFMHPSVVLAAFVATALMQGRKSGDAGAGTGGGTPGKAGLDARTAAPQQANRAQLQDSLLALTATDAAGGPAGQGGFMLHSAGLASAMALVVAAVTPAASGGDGTTQTMLESLTRAMRGSSDSDGRDHGTETAANTGEPVRTAASLDGRGLDDPAHGNRGIETLDTAKLVRAPHHPETPRATETPDAPAAHDVVVDADLFLAEVMQGTGAGRPETESGADARAPAGSTPDPVAAGATLDSSGEVAGKTASAGSTPDTGTAASADGSSGQTADSTAEPRSGSGEAQTARVGPTDTGDDESDSKGSGSGLKTEAGDGGSESPLGETGRIGDTIALTDDALRLLDVARNGGSGDGDTLDALLDDLGGTVTVDLLAPDAGAVGSWLVVLRDSHDGTAGGNGAATGGNPPVVPPGSTGTGGGTPGTEDPASEAQIVVYSGGQLRLEAFDPATDLLSVTGPMVGASQYDIVATDEGVDIRFDADNIVTLVGVGLDDLGLA